MPVCMHVNECVYVCHCCCPFAHVQVEVLVDGGLQLDEVCVLTYYMKQLQLIKSALRQKSLHQASQSGWRIGSDGWNEGGGSNGMVYGRSQQSVSQRYA